MGGGGGLNHLPLLFRKIMYCIKHHLKMINALHERKTYQPVNFALAGTPAEQNEKWNRSAFDENWQGIPTTCLILGGEVMVPRDNQLATGQISTCN